MGHHYFEAEARIWDAHINVQEMWGVYAGCLRWSDRWDDSSVMIVTDSDVVQAALNTGRSRCKEIMFYVRRLFWLAVEHNFVFSAIYIRSEVNNVCDALSRLNEQNSCDRLRGLDSGGKMCCGGLFDTPFFSYRTGQTGKTEGVSKPVLCKELFGVSVGTNQEIFRVC